MTRIEAMIQNRDRLSPSLAERPHPGSISSQSTLRAQMTLGPQLSNIGNGVHATTATWNDTELWMNMETSLLQSPPSMSSAPGQPVPSYQNLTPSARQDVAKTAQDLPQDLSDVPKEDCDALNMDKEATILAPQVVSIHSSRCFCAG